MKQSQADGLTDKTAKAKATREAKAEQFKAQAIEIDENWRIVRADELNWEIQHQGKFEGYFPDLVAAFKALPARLLSSGSKNSVADVIRSQKAIEERILSALNMKLAT